MIKDQCIHELKGTNRAGIDYLISVMTDGGFFEAPCSGKKSYHLAEPEGLLIHSMNVLKVARNLNESLEAGIADEHIVLVSLLHDLGKMGDHGKPYYSQNILKSGKQSEAEPYKHNSDLVYMDHEVRSVMIAERYIHLTEGEEQAILHHNGLYGTFKYQIPGKETPLSLILQWADMWASRVVEGGEE